MYLLYNSHLRVIFFENEQAVMTEIDIERKTKQLLKNTKNYFSGYQTLSPEEKKLIRKAFDVSWRFIKEQEKIRRSLIFSIHIAVAKIVA
jgi:GTP pyrophosphokinase